MKFFFVFFIIMGLFMVASSAPTNFEVRYEDVPIDDIFIGDGYYALCTNGQVICAAAADNGYDGGVFECIDGRLVLIEDCSASEKCIKDPSPHCARAKSLE